MKHNAQKWLTGVVAGAALLMAGAWAMAADEPAKKAAYPLTTCVVSGEKLGEMGDAIKYQYQGREVQFCCKGCIKAFEKDPAKYLKLIDDATKAKADAAAKAATAAPAPAAK